MTDVRLTEIQAGDYVYVVIRKTNKAFLNQDRVYRPSRLYQQNHPYHSASRAFGRVLEHDINAQTLTIQPSFEMDVGSNRPNYPMELPWWSIQHLYRFTGDYTSPTTARGKELGSAVFNRLRAAYHRELTTEPIENVAAPGVKPAMLFEKVRLQ